jgi:hypothetical protein
VIAHGVRARGRWVGSGCRLRQRVPVALGSWRAAAGVFRHLVEPLTYTYAAPASASVPKAPTTAVFPDIATEHPNSSPTVFPASRRVVVGIVGQPAPFM